MARSIGGWVDRLCLLWFPAPGLALFAIVNHMANNAVLDRTFTACSHPIRRGILERLASGEMTVGEATGDFGVSKPAISRHLKLLEEAGAITRIVDGRTHRLRLDERPFEEAYDWMQSQRQIWERKLDTVEEYLRERRGAGGDGREPRKKTQNRRRDDRPDRDDRHAR